MGLTEDATGDTLDTVLVVPADADATTALTAAVLEEGDRATTGATLRLAAAWTADAAGATDGTAAATVGVVAADATGRGAIVAGAGVAGVLTAEGAGSVMPGTVFAAATLPAAEAAASLLRSLMFFDNSATRVEDSFA